MARYAREFFNRNCELLYTILHSLHIFLGLGPNSDCIGGFLIGQCKDKALLVCQEFVEVFDQSMGLLVFADKRNAKIFTFNSSVFYSQVDYFGKSANNATYEIGSS